jgi:hypothetical protein
MQDDEFHAQVDNLISQTSAKPANQTPRKTKPKPATNKVLGKRTTKERF